MIVDIGMFKIVFDKLRLGTAAMLALSVVASSLVMPTAAEAATFSFSPSSKTVNEGEEFTVRVLVNTSEKAASLKFAATYSRDILKAMNVSCSPGYMEVAPQIANGSVANNCAAIPPQAPYSGNGVHAGTITFKAMKAGTATLNFGASLINRQAEPFGNMYTGGSSATITVAAKPSSAPAAPPPPSTNTHHAPAPPPTQTYTGVSVSTISSSSHPDQNAWYKERQLKFDWSGGGDGYNFDLDTSPNTQLPQSVRGNTTTHSQEVDGDGVYYFHVRKKQGENWSATSHYRVQVDGNAPTEVSVNVEPESPMTVLPHITMSASDNGSGIDRFEVAIDDGDWHKVGDGYKPETLTSGSHTIKGRAYDKAGNFADATKTIEIVPLAAPELTSPKSGILRLGERFVIEGQSIPETTIELYINGELKEKVTSDAEGRFVSSDEFMLFPGTYEVAARAVNGDGISSPQSELVTVTIDAQAVSVMGFVLPGWGVYGGLGVSVTAVIVGMLWGLYRLWRQTRMWMGKLQWVGTSVDKELAELEQELAQSLEEHAGTMDPATVEALRQKIAERVKQAETDIDSSLAGSGGVGVDLHRKGVGVWIEQAKQRAGGLVTGGVVWLAMVQQKAMAVLPGRRVVEHVELNGGGERQPKVDGDQGQATGDQEELSKLDDSKDSSAASQSTSSSSEAPVITESTVPLDVQFSKGSAEGVVKPTEQSTHTNQESKNENTDTEPKKEGLNESSVSSDEADQKTDETKPSEPHFDKIPGIKDILVEGE